jgi:hypothetical protein
MPLSTLLQSLYLLTSLLNLLLIFYYQMQDPLSTCHHHTWCHSSPKTMTEPIRSTSTSAASSWAPPCAGSPCTPYYYMCWINRWWADCVSYQAQGDRCRSTLNSTWAKKGHQVWTSIWQHQQEWQSPLCIQGSAVSSQSHESDVWNVPPAWACCQRLSTTQTGINTHCLSTFYSSVHSGHVKEG